MSTLPEIVYDDGVHLLGSILWMDPVKGRDMAVLTHAGRAPRARCQKVACTAETDRLVRALWARKRFQPLVAPCEYPFQLGPLQLTLHHAGFILGSAQIEVQVKGSRILYTGDLDLTGAGDLESARPHSADVLIVSAQLGRPGLVLPDRESVRYETLQFVTETILMGEVPILACDELGVVRDVATFLANHGHTPLLHARYHRYLGACREFGFPTPSGRRHTGGDSDGVPIWPLDQLNSPTLPRKRRRVLALTALAATPRGRAALPADHAIPWTRHPSYDALMEFIDAVGAERVYTLRGFEVELAESLRDRGHWSQALSPGLQMGLII